MLDGVSLDQLRTFMLLLMKAAFRLQPANCVGRCRLSAIWSAVSKRRWTILDDVKPAVGEIASMLFDNPDQGLFIFAVTHPDDMLQDLRKRYYAESFQL
jgi:hypothetical protein